MNKLLILFVIGFLMVGGVLAVDNSRQGAAKDDTVQADEKAIPQSSKNSVSEENLQLQESASNNEVSSKDKVEAAISAENTQRMQLRTENTGDGEKLKVTLSNGQEREVKIMPETASATAISRLGLNNCVEAEGCTIELKEVGKGNETSLAYEVETETEGKFLGLFKTRAKVRTTVSAETGEVLRVKKPFLTSVKEDKSADANCEDACPQLAPVGPEFCKNGEIVSGGVDKCGCNLPPKCEEENAQIANPASEYCEDNGGVVEMKTADDGSVSGVCIIDEIECDEWELFRGDCEAMHICTQAEKEAELCTMEYMPVCGDDMLTYGNKCTACQTEGVKYYTPGECREVVTE